MVSEPRRLDLFQPLEQSIGPGPARTLMTLLRPGEVALRSDVAATRAELKADIAEVRSDLVTLKAQVNARFEVIEGKVDALAATVEAKIDAQIPRFLLATVPMMCGTAGLVLAAAKLA